MTRRLGDKKSKMSSEDKKEGEEVIEVCILETPPSTPPGGAHRGMVKEVKKGASQSQKEAERVRVEDRKVEVEAARVRVVEKNGMTRSLVRRKQDWEKHPCFEFLRKQPKGSMEMMYLRVYELFLTNPRKALGIPDRSLVSAENLVLNEPWFFIPGMASLKNVMGKRVNYLYFDEEGVIRIQPFTIYLNDNTPAAIEEAYTSLLRFVQQNISSFAVIFALQVMKVMEGQHMHKSPISMFLWSPVQYFCRQPNPLKAFEEMYGPHVHFSISLCHSVPRSTYSKILHTVNTSGDNVTLPLNLTKAMIQGYFTQWEGTKLFPPRHEIARKKFCTSEEKK